MNIIFKNHFSDEDIPLLMNTISILKSDWETGMQLLVGQGYYNPLIKALREYYVGYFKPTIPHNVLLKYSISSDKISTNGYHLTSSKDKEGFNMWLPLFPARYDLHIVCERTNIMNCQDVHYPIHLHTSESYGVVNMLPQTITALTYQVGLDKYCKVLQSLVNRQPLETLEITDYMYFGSQYVISDSFLAPDKTIDLSNCTNLKNLNVKIMLSGNYKLPKSLKRLTIDSPYTFLGMDKQYITNILEQCPKLEYLGVPVDANTHEYLLEQGFIKDGGSYIKQ